MNNENSAAEIEVMLKVAMEACENLEFRKALPLLLQLADKSIPVACMNLGYIYKYGNVDENIQPDEKQSTFWYSKYFFLLNILSNKGDWDANFELASCYQYGDNIACDEKKAVELYTVGAEAGHLKSQYHHRHYGDTGGDLAPVFRIP